MISELGALSFVLGARVKAIQDKSAATEPTEIQTMATHNLSKFCCWFSGCAPVVFLAQQSQTSKS